MEPGNDLEYNELNDDSLSSVTGGDGPVAAAPDPSATAATPGGAGIGTVIGMGAAGGGAWMLGKKQGAEKSAQSLSTLKNTHQEALGVLDTARSALQKIGSIRK